MAENAKSDAGTIAAPSVGVIAIFTIIGTAPGLGGLATCSLTTSCAGARIWVMVTAIWVPAVFAGGKFPRPGTKVWAVSGGFFEAVAERGAGLGVDVVVEVMGADSDGGILWLMVV